MTHVAAPTGSGESPKSTPGLAGATRMLSVIDSHTAGCTTRIVVGGILSIPGATMVDKKLHAEQHLTSVRTALLCEPRGNREMAGALVTEPTTDEADLGVIFMDPTTFEHMSGHGSIGVVSAVIETGMVAVTEPVTTVVLDTPVGLVEGRARIENGEITSVSITNVPSFLYVSTKIEVPGIGEVKADVAFGGDTYVIVGTDDIGVEVDPANSFALMDIGRAVKKAANEQIDYVHPTLPDVDSIGGVRVNTVPEPSKGHAKETVIWADSMIDRSPCGTGVCADLAASYAKGLIGVGEQTMHESIIGTVFGGKVLAETKVGHLDAVIPEISGRAFITGFNTILIDPRDPLKDGFLVY